MNNCISGFKNYRIINNVLLISFSCLLFYFAIIEYTALSYPLTSVYKDIVNVESKGLQRSIGMCLRMDFDEAEKMNKSGLFVFLFFVIQIVFRSLIVLLYKRTSNALILTDVAISVILFFIAFRNFIILLF